jgi:hypothetical protein
MCYKGLLAEIQSFYYIDAIRRIKLLNELHMEFIWNFPMLTSV